jgi:hypothetical protein
MMATLRRAILFSILFILLAHWTSPAQQPQPGSVDELKRQIAKLEEVERNPDTPPEVKRLNRTFLEARRSDLRGLLAHRINALRSYLSSNGGVLKSSEVKTVEDSIRGLEAELQSLPAGAHPENDRVTRLSPPLPADSPTARSLAVTNRADVGPAPSGGLPAQGACDDLIRDGLIVKAPFQNDLEINLRVPLSLLNRPDVTSRRNEIRIPTGHFRINVPDGATSTTLTPARSVSTISGRTVLRVPLTGSIPPSATTANVTLSDLVFDCPRPGDRTVIEAVSKSVEIKSNADALANDIGALNKAKKEAAKRSNDKNFRLGFSAAKGDGGDAQGAADISINRKFFGGEDTGTVFDFFDQADLALQLKKASAEKADPRHLTLGLNLRKTYLVFSSLKESNTITAGHDDRSKGFFRVLMINEGLNLEGEAFDFKTTNFVSDMHIELASIAKKLGSGFYNLNLFAGPEIGRNLSKPDGATAVGVTADQLGKVDWITRFKAGGQFTLRLLPAGKEDNWGVELDLGYVNRRIFNSEVFTQQTMKDGQTIKKLVTIGEGNRAWRQADLKVFLFGDQSMRYGVRFSYTNGQLPPAFTPTKSFQFGLVVESSDDKRSGEPINKP